MNLPRIKQALLAHYTANPKRVFRQFKMGAVIFFVGLGTILFANNAIPPSTRQELVVLLGLMLTGLGLIWALMAEVRLLIGRIIGFLNK